MIRFRLIIVAVSLIFGFGGMVSADEAQDFFAAVRNNKEAQVKALLLKNPDIVKARDNRGGTALIYAAGSCRLGIVSLLVSHGADVNATDIDFSRTALMRAAQEGRNDVIRLLLSRGAKLNIKNRNGRTALMYAVRHDFRGTADLLLKNGADINAQDSSGKTALILEVINNNYDMTGLLLA